MALVTVQRSPCGANSNPNCHNQTTDETDGSNNKEGDELTKEKKSISECYFAVKGAALVLPHDECIHVHRKTIANGASDIQQHLQAMLYLLHADDILKMAVKLESIHSSRTRYLVVVFHTGKSLPEESCLLGIDCNNQTTIGLVLPVWADTSITLDGDGGFSVTSSGRHHIFKPVSVQAMWSALQTLHKASSKAREYNYFKCGGTHQWVDYYEKRISSDRSCLNEWHAMDDIESRRPPSPDIVRLQPTEREETERHIRTKLKELMMSVDLDEVTSKYIRTRLEEMLDMSLKEYKSFIDQEMLTILGQMDAPTEIFQYLYLGSEWNASNLEELVVNGIGHILNVTREIDNFFPGVFDYQNIRVYDDESTEILHYWDKTYRYIRRAKDEGSKVLVHCKMGISRSASVVIAYVMKAYDWNLQRALDFVKTKRGCIKPNSGFLKQLEIYQGILDASKQRHNSLWRSKSETNLKLSEKPKKKTEDKKEKVQEKSGSFHHLRVYSNASSRPKSWSPSDSVADMLFPPQNSLSTEIYRTGDVAKDQNESEEKTSTKHLCIGNDPVSLHLGLNDCVLPRSKKDPEIKSMEILNPDISLPRVSSIKDRINELESQVTSSSEKPKSEAKSPASQSRSGLVLNLANQFESTSKPSSPIDDGLVMKCADDEIVEPVVSQTKPAASKHHAVLVKSSLWPEENAVSPNSVNIAEAKASAFLKSNNTENKPSKIPHSDAYTTSKILPEESSHNVPLSPKFSDRTCKASHSIQNSAFKPFVSCADTHVQPIHDVKSDSVSMFLSGSDHNSHENSGEKKNHEKSSSFKNAERNAKLVNNSVKDFKAIDNLSTVRNQHKNFDYGNSATNKSKPSITEAMYVSDISDVPSKGSYFYDKEAIPFTPGTVQRTKQKIEEKNLTRATSFDSGFPFRAHSMPSTPPEAEYFAGKLVRRSNSLRNDCRPNIPFCGKWYPLPALASTSPHNLKSLQDKIVQNSSESNPNMMHSISTPSVVEAVNRVICGTQEVLTSAIHFIPSEKKMFSNHASSDSDFDFGSVSSLPDMDISDFTIFEKTCTQSESPVPGIVKQQCEILENKVTRTVGDKRSSDLCKAKRDVLETLPLEESNLVATDPSKENGKESGIVKRLKKELEAKSNVDNSCKKDKISNVVALGDAEELSKCTEIDPSTVDKKMYRLTSEPGPDQRLLRQSLENKQNFDQKAPPTPHRKTSLDLSFLQKRFPLNIKLGIQAQSICPSKTPVRTTTMDQEYKKAHESSVDGCKISSSRPPTAAKTSPSGITEIPPPPPPPVGLPRKMRKQQGSTHPLSKLIRQRHPNPLYNTM